jgi:hypothetical protein
MVVKMKVMRKAIIMMIQMINTNKMFSINRMLLDSMFLTNSQKQINYKNLFQPVDYFFKIVFKLNSQLKKK